MSRNNHMLTCLYCQTENQGTATLCASCGSSLSADVLPNGTRLFSNTLKIIQVIGRGGFGIVYEVVHLQHQKRLAVKELFPEGLATRGYNTQVISIHQSGMQSAIARTNREAKMLRNLKHPSATKLFAYWEENNTTYMAMEYLAGETLEQRIQTGKLLTETEAKSALLTILEVLEELHGHGFLHRDIKPANIIFTPSRVELIDFGSLTEFKNGERIKVSNRIVTLEYAPLEQFGGEVELTPATDLYALAATFCEAITGIRVPNALERANGASIEPNMLALQKFSKELSDVFEKALEMRVKNRFIDVNTMRTFMVQSVGPKDKSNRIKKPTLNWRWVLTRALTLSFFLCVLLAEVYDWKSITNRSAEYLLSPSFEQFKKGESLVIRFLNKKDGQLLALRNFIFPSKLKEYNLELESFFLPYNRRSLAVSFIIKRDDDRFHIISFYNLQNQKRFGFFYFRDTTKLKNLNKYLGKNIRKNPILFQGNHYYWIFSSRFAYKFDINGNQVDFIVRRNIVDDLEKSYYNLYEKNRVREIETLRRLSNYVPKMEKPFLFEDRNSYNIFGNVEIQRGFFGNFLYVSNDNRITEFEIK